MFLTNIFCIFFVPFNNQSERVSCILDDPCGLVVSHVKNVFTVDLDQVVIGATTSHSGYAVQGNLKKRQIYFLMNKQYKEN